MRMFLVVLSVWLLIGALAAWQRNYFTAASANCAGVGTILVTIAFGPVKLPRRQPEAHLSLARSSGFSAWGSSGWCSSAWGSSAGAGRASRADTAARMALRPAPRGTLRDT